MKKNLRSRVPILVLAISLPLVIATSSAAPVNMSAKVAARATGIDNVAERIGGAFSTLSQASIEQVSADTVILTPKGNRQRKSDCASATWANIDKSCLSTADGSLAPQVRTITVSYQAGANTTLLLRFPAAEPQR